MKWFKHDGHARSDDKIEKLLIKYGVEGYGLYFYCVEIIAGNISSENITFELKHDAETIAARLKMDTLKVEEIMKFMINQGLFQINPATERIMCIGLAKRLDNSMRQSQELKNIIETTDFKKLQEIAKNFKQTRLEETRKEENKDNTLSRVDTLVEAQKDEKEQIPYKKIVTLLNRECNTNYRHTTQATQRLIKARWNEGWREEDFETVIKAKAKVWLNDPKMVQYLRPQTIFGSKFEGYLQAARQTYGQKKKCEECKVDFPYHLPSCSKVKEE